MDKAIIDQLNRIERYSIISAKTALTMEEAVFYTGFSKSQLYHLTSTKRIPHYKVGTRAVFDKTELDQWLRQNRVATQEEIDREADRYIAKNTGSNGHKK